ncbi:MAG TPA: hypothetical protein VFS02_03925 [Telluria sp.]|nr:hypothetical protein [Telluria sp.]
MYNSRASTAQRKDMQRPAFIQASKELAAADSAIRHEGVGCCNRSRGERA